VGHAHYHDPFPEGAIEEAASDFTAVLAECAAMGFLINDVFVVRTPIVSVDGLVPPRSLDGWVEVWGIVSRFPASAGGVLGVGCWVGGSHVQSGTLMEAT
jgi:hypothetical protein